MDNQSPLKNIMSTVSFRRRRVYFIAAITAAIIVLLDRRLWTNYYYLPPSPPPPSLISPEIAAETCPAAIRKAIGIYDWHYQGFENVLLLVSSNYGYLDFLLNWEYLAKKHGLKYGIASMDERLYKYLGGEGQSILSNKLMESQESSFREKSFNDISCNKLAVVLDIMNRCDVDVVFSDVDNILLQDPFQHDLGRLIQMNVYDYIYSPNTRTTDRRGHSCLNHSVPLEEEGNTGFYYISKKAKIVKELMNNALQACKEKSNELDDQALFWHQIFTRRNHTKTNTQPWYHCSVDDGYDSPPKLTDDSIQTTSETLVEQNGVKLCCLDAYYYMPGAVEERFEGDKSSIVTFHANWVTGSKGKIKKLKSVDGWNIDYIDQMKIMSSDDDGGVTKMKAEEKVPFLIKSGRDVHSKDITVPDSS